MGDGDGKVPGEHSGEVKRHGRAWVATAGCEEPPVATLPAHAVMGTALSALSCRSHRPGECRGESPEAAACGPGVGESEESVGGEDQAMRPGCAGSSRLTLLRPRVGVKPGGAGGGGMAGVATADALLTGGGGAPQPGGSGNGGTPVQSPGRGG